MIRGFDPIEAPDAKLLILGTIPGQESLEKDQYYANSRNDFWFIMQRLLNAKSELDYEARKSLICQAKLAIWDVLASAERKGSLDSSIVAGSETPNNFRRFLKEHGTIHAAFFNGGTAEKLFRRLVLPNLPERGTNLQLRYLPSTSPANTRYTREGKLRAWAVIMDTLGSPR